MLAYHDDKAGNGEKERQNFACSFFGTCGLPDSYAHHKIGTNALEKDVPPVTFKQRQIYETSDAQRASRSSQHQD